MKKGRRSKVEIDVYRSVTPAVYLTWIARGSTIRNADCQDPDTGSTLFRLLGTDFSREGYDTIR